MKQIKISKKKKTLRGGSRKNRKGSENKLRLKLNRKDLKRRLKMSENESKKRKRKESD